MNDQQNIFQPIFRLGRQFVTLLGGALAVLVLATPSLAHHAMGGRMPVDFWGGFLSGLAHPIIGPDHFAAVVAIGLLATTQRRGIWLPIVFLSSALVGTGLHLARLTIPGLELGIAGSILLFGYLLSRRQSLAVTIILPLAALAGTLHGYAYGESIVGATPTPLVAYLLGFTAIQLTICLAAFQIGRSWLKVPTAQGLGNLRVSGLVISGMGLAWFVSQLMGLLLPNPG